MGANRMGWLWTACLVALLGAATAARADDGPRDRALALNAVTGTGPMRGELKKLLDDPAATKKLLAVAVEMTKEKPQPLNSNATFLLAVAAAESKDVEISARFYRLFAAQSLAVLSERGLAKAYGGLIQMYYDNKKYAEAEKVCLELLNLKDGGENDALERLRPMVMRQMILAIAKQGSADRALGLVEKLIKADPENWLALSLKGQVQREAGNSEEAAKTYLAVIEAVKADKRLEKEERDEFVDQYRYLLSGVYTDLEQIDKATEQLKTLLAKHPENPTYNNDLGYIWAERNMNLPEAEKLIRKALEEDRKQRKEQKLAPDEDRDSAAYLDSLGWVLFKQGKAKEARDFLVQAVKDKEGQHIEILDHLGDVYQELGEKGEAVATWKKALESGTESKRDLKRKTEIEKKLKAKE